MQNRAQCISICKSWEKTGGLAKPLKVKEANNMKIDCGECIRCRWEVPFGPIYAFGGKHNLPDPKSVAVFQQKTPYKRLQITSRNSRKTISGKVNSLTANFFNPGGKRHYNQFHCCENR
jgi:hypothetical protein